MKIGKTLRVQFMKWFWYNLFTFPVLMTFYIPYQLFWIGLSPIQLLKYIATAGFFGAAVNLVMRPVVAWITHFVDKRYGKNRVPEEHSEWETVIDEDEVWYTPKEKKVLNSPDVPSTVEETSK
jgi:hypothetical protein